MKQFISFPKIGALRNIVKDIDHATHYVGQDDDDNPIYDTDRKNPVLKFKGTVKLHGTNAGVSYNSVDGIWTQSRKNIITTEQDNAGFAAFVEDNINVFERFFASVSQYIRDENTIVTIFGEWAGNNIQAGMAINGIPKFYAVFAVKISYSREERLFLADEEWEHIKDHDIRIYNVQEWKSWEIEIDFNNVEGAIPRLLEITDDVEKQCPVGLYFGKEGAGEGVVWVHHSEKHSTIRFKVKSEKHSSSKPRRKKAASVDPETLNDINEFVEYAVTENRLNQGIETVFTMKGEEIDIKKMGEFLSWVSHDIQDEEMDVLLESALTMKQVGKAISLKARKWFLEKWNRF